jgi:CDGSH-type Zn-finger protein
MAPYYHKRECRSNGSGARLESWRTETVEPFRALCDVLQQIPPGRTIMDDVMIKALKDGPYEVAGGAKVLDNKGKEYAESQFPPLYLCRCGQSKNKPFCDGSHKDAGFKSDEAAS